MDDRADKNDLRAQDDLRASTVAIVSAYLAHNPMPADAVPAFIQSIFDSVAGLGQIAATPALEQTPAVPIAQSLTDDAIICLEDGLPFKSLKRHLRTKYDLTPDAYRQKWGLPHDYPMVAPSYAKARSKLARESGLGRKKGPR